MHFFDVVVAGQGRRAGFAVRVRSIGGIAVFVQIIFTNPGVNLPIFLVQFRQKI